MNEAGDDGEEGEDQSKREEEQEQEEEYKEGEDEVEVVKTIPAKAEWKQMVRDSSSSQKQTWVQMARRECEKLNHILCAVLHNRGYISGTRDFDLLLQDLEQVLSSLVQLSQSDKDNIMVHQDYFEPLFKHIGSQTAKTGKTSP